MGLRRRLPSDATPARMDLPGLSSPAALPPGSLPRLWRRQASGMAGRRAARLRVLRGCRVDLRLYRVRPRGSPLRRLPVRSLLPTRTPHRASHRPHDQPDPHPASARLRHARELRTPANRGVVATEEARHRAAAAASNGPRRDRDQPRHLPRPTLGPASRLPTLPPHCARCPGPDGHPDRKDAALDRRGGPRPVA